MGSYRYYWQAEFVNSLHSYDGTTTTEETFVQNSNGVRQLQRTTTSSEYSNVNWEIPVLMRYNINDFIGIGAGLQANFNVSEKQEQNLKIETLKELQINFYSRQPTNRKTEKESFTSFKTGLLFDLTIGAARIRPSFGARYVMNFEANFNYIQAVWHLEVLGNHL